MGVRDWKKGFESERGKEYVNKKGVPEVVLELECYVEEDVCQSGQMNVRDGSMKRKRNVDVGVYRSIFIYC